MSKIIKTIAKIILSFIISMFVIFMSGIVMICTMFDTWRLLRLAFVTLVACIAFFTLFGEDD